MRGATGVSVMSGYRDRSTFDPYGTPSHGRPLRPFNWVQWTGVALMLLGIGIDLLYFAGRLGWVRPIATPMYAFAPLILGVTLMNSRREEVPDLAPELAGARKRWMLITILVCVVIIGAAVAIDVWSGK
jgi:hypothetical protein